MKITFYSFKDTLIILHFYLLILHTMSLNSLNCHSAMNELVTMAKIYR